MITHTIDSCRIPSQKTNSKWQNCKKLYTWHSFWSCLIRCIYIYIYIYIYIWNGSSKNCWRYRADTIPSTDGRTDRQTYEQMDGQGETSITPFPLRWSGGYNNHIWGQYLAQQNTTQCCTTLINNRLSTIIIGLFLPNKTLLWSMRWHFWICGC